MCASRSRRWTALDRIVDGRPGAWILSENSGFSGGVLAGKGRYAALTIAARPADGVIRHVNAADRTIRPPVDHATGLRLRHRMVSAGIRSESSKTVAMDGSVGGAAGAQRRSGSHPSTHGDSPLRYCDRIPTVTVRWAPRSSDSSHPIASSSGMCCCRRPSCRARKVKSSSNPMSRSFPMTWSTTAIDARSGYGSLRFP